MSIIGNILSGVTLGSQLNSLKTQSVEADSETYRSLDNLI